MLGLAHDRVINPRKSAAIFQSHIGVEICAAKQGDDIGIAFFDQLREGDAGDILVEGGGEAHHGILAPIDSFYSPVEKLGNHLAFNLM